MWKQYFGPGTRIYGIDTNPKCKALEEENINILIGSQSDRTFLRSVKTLIPPIDILIDDGGHTMKQQRIAFEELFDHVKDDGVYLIEDLHTSYWMRYGGGHKRMGTFIEYSKTLIDRLNAWHSHQRSLRADSLTSALESLHFYDSVLVIEKKHRERPIEKRTGRENIEVEIPPHLRSGSNWRALRPRRSTAGARRTRGSRCACARPRPT